MNIEKIYIKNFGALKDFECDFSKGVNVIEGPNEAGKSTLGEFIKFIFFGLSAKTDGTHISERKKYQSFKDGSAGGYMEFESGGKRYKIERTIIPDINGAGRETIRILDLETQEECLKGEDPAMYFFGVDGDVYAQTAYVSQSGGSGIERPTIQEAIENMLFSGNELISTDAASKAIEKEALTLLYKNKKGGLIYDLTLEKDKLSRQIEEERAKNSRIIELDHSLKTLKEQKAELDLKISACKIELDGCEGRRTLEKLDALKDKEFELRESEEKKQSYITEHSHEGFIPDNDYIQKISALSSEVEFYNKELEKAKENKMTLGSDKIDTEDMVLLNKVQADGGADQLNDFFDNAHRSSRSSLMTGIFFIIFTLIWGAIAAVFMFVDEISAISFAGFTLYQGGYVAIGISALILILSIVFFLRSRSLSKKIDKKLDDYGATSEDDIFVALNSAMNRASNQEIYIEKLAAAESACKRVEKEIASRENDIRSECQKWGKEYTDVSSLDAILKEAQSVIGDIESLNDEIKIKNAQLDVMKKSYADLSRENAEYAVNSAHTLPSDEEEKALLENMTSLRKDMDELSDTLRSSELELARIEATEGNIAELIDKYDAVSCRIDTLTKRHTMLTLALQSISKASADLRASISPKLSMRAGEYMRTATDDKYASLIISPAYTVKYGINAGGDSFASKDEDYMSEGTRDIAYVSLRLALVGLIYKKELPTLVFDEAFARLDDNRLESMSSIIGKYAEESAQVFVLTSQKRDAEIISKTAKVTHIKIGY